MVVRSAPDRLFDSVTATVLARRTGAVLGVVRRENRPVLVSVRGQVVAVLEPASHGSIAREFDLDDEELLVSHRFLEQNGPGPVLDAVMGGAYRVQTFQNEPYAVWKPIEQWNGFDQLFADVPEPGPEVDADAVTTPRRDVAADLATVLTPRHPNLIPTERHIPS